MSKIKHESKFYVRFSGKESVNFPANFTVYPGSVYGRFSNSEGKKIFWVCDCYQTVNGKLPVHIFNGSYWKLSLINANHPCYKWVKIACEKLGYIPKPNTENLSFEECKEMMKSYALHKNGTGSRINTHQINNPLQWNEVTEYAHWYGKGNASVVANGMRY